MKTRVQLEPPGKSNQQELARLARLRMLAIMDTDPEPLFDSLARMASTVCGTPIALVTLLDDQRQWFKANIGLEPLRQTNRAMAFCAHAIQGSTLMEVCDTQKDARFSQNALVKVEPDIRFYAGVPLVMPEGERLGTLCVMDREVRRLTTPQRNALVQLAEIVVQALLLRERSRHLKLTAKTIGLKLSRRLHRWAFFTRMPAVIAPTPIRNGVKSLVSHSSKACAIHGVR